MWGSKGSALGGVEGQGPSPCLPFRRPARRDFDIEVAMAGHSQFKNITNPTGYRYVGSLERNLEYEEFGWWVTFGTKFNF